MILGDGIYMYTSSVVSEVDRLRFVQRRERLEIALYQDYFDCIAVCRLMSF